MEIRTIQGVEYAVGFIEEGEGWFGVEQGWYWCVHDGESEDLAAQMNDTVGPYPSKERAVDDMLAYIRGS